MVHFHYLRTEEMETGESLRLALLNLAGLDKSVMTQWLRALGVHAEDSG